jgi:hypothetical protein
MDGGNYDVIRRRLQEQAQTLRAHADTLNERRKSIFGGTELSIIGNERIRTEDNRLPRDLIALSGTLLFGFNVSYGLKKDVPLSSIFSFHSFQSGPNGPELTPLATESALGGAFNHPEFIKQFQDLYQYSKTARLLQLRTTDAKDPKLLAVFQTGSTFQDVLVFRWAISPTGQLSFIDNRGDRDHIFPNAHDFTWTQTTKNDEVTTGPDPHVSILDEVFVETIKGDLTIKVENNTSDGQGIYSEPVDEPDQSLSDGKFFYAKLGSLILLKILPYREKAWRYFIFNTRTKSIARLDAIGQGCVQLPEDHGVIFPGGFYLQSGQYKSFGEDTSALVFMRSIKSPNGEDVLYVFYQAESGSYVLYPYNLIRKEVQTPIHCHGLSTFDDGKMLIFKDIGEEASRVHPIQVWQTPFTSLEFAASIPRDGSYLSNVGNPDLVRGISDAFSICRLIDNDNPTRLTYEDLVSASTRILDSYYWISHADACGLQQDLQEIRRTAELIIDEFEKVISFRKRAAEAMTDAEASQQTLLSKLRTENFRAVDEFLTAMTSLRQQRGHLITLRDVRFIDLPRIEALEAATIEHFDRVSRDCIRFLLRPEAMQPLLLQISHLTSQIDQTQKVSDTEPLNKKLTELTDGLNLLAEVISNIQVDDTTIRTQILELISEVFSQLNRTRALLVGRRKTLLSQEGRAEFAAQFALFSQSVSSALTMADSPERCDELLARLMLQLEELEGKFSEFEEFLAELSTKRDDVYEALSSRKQTLLDDRQRRIQNLLGASDRILQGVSRRAKSFKDEDELNAYFASDPMVMKLRQISTQLLDLKDSVKADEQLSRLKSSRQDALRILRDKLDLFEGGDAIIKFGRHRFSVNTQPLELTLVPRGDTLALHLTGTDFYEPIDDPAFLQTRHLWSQQLISETDQVYRAEFLAAQVLFKADSHADGLSLHTLHDAQRSEGGLLDLIRKLSSDRYDEGYERGLHDHDASLILDKLLAMRTTAGLLRFAPHHRAMACLTWAFTKDKNTKDLWTRRARSLGRLRAALAFSPALTALGDELGTQIAKFYQENALPFAPSDPAFAGLYLVEELIASDRPTFITSPEAEALRDALLLFLDNLDQRVAFEDDLRALERNLSERSSLILAWLDAFLSSNPTHEPLRPSLHEAAALLLTDRRLDRRTSNAVTHSTVIDLLGQHPLVHNRALPIRLDEFTSRLSLFLSERVPAFRHYRSLRASFLDRERKRLRIDEFLPRVMTSFVRNRLINDVYLPLIGDNLAKQMGTVGDSKRTDLMGLLLLISPPGYGKTTLMEYVANRLGLVFMKINGPALGHDVTSIDPNDAPNATARQEVNKINLALEMGNNVMLYLDDIQHTNPELLQKFISLCDAQRKIEGVWRDQTRTYDMRGKKFCVVMAGNPYTETGEKFRIPDMLANRADTYNLGDILQGKGDAFALSFIENALTSSATLSPLATRDQADTYKLIRMAQGHDIPTSDLKHAYSGMELNEITTVFKHLFKAQEVLLKVNQSYIASASIEDAFRTEPSFKLQGSYRNMNKITEKVVAAMNPQELERLITDHYAGESQTLTTGAEHNLLKLAELRGVLTPTQRARWDDIKKNFRRIQLTGAATDDPVSRVTGSLSSLGGYLDGIQSTLAQTAQSFFASKQDRGEVELDPMGAANAAASSEALAQRLEPMLEKLSASLQILGRPQLEVRVEHQAPPGVDELLAQQVAIIERTLVPLVRTTTQHLGDAMAIHHKLDELISLLRQADIQLRAPANRTAPNPTMNPAIPTTQQLQKVEAHPEDAWDQALSSPGPIQSGESHVRRPGPLPPPRKR